MFLLYYLTQNCDCMEENKLITTYKSLPRSEKGSFLVHLSVLCGGSPTSWTNKMAGRTRLNLSAVEKAAITDFIENKKWK